MLVMNRILRSKTVDHEKLLAERVFKIRVAGECLRDRRLSASAEHQQQQCTRLFCKKEDL